MEQAELEAAIALSLAVEEERLRLLQMDAKHEHITQPQAAGHKVHHPHPPFKHHETQAASIKPLSLEKFYPIRSCPPLCVY